MNDEVIEFLKQLESGVEPVDSATIIPHGERPCPICGQKMAVDVEQGVQTDVCSEHGVWLDTRELFTIMSRVRSRERRRATQGARKAKREGIRTGAACGLWGLLLND